MRINTTPVGWAVYSADATLKEEDSRAMPQIYMLHRYEGGLRASTYSIPILAFSSVEAANREASVRNASNNGYSYHVEPMPLVGGTDEAPHSSNAIQNTDKTWRADKSRDEGVRGFAACLKSLRSQGFGYVHQAAIRLADGPAQRPFSAVCVIVAGKSDEDAARVLRRAIHCRDRCCPDVATARRLEDGRSLTHRLHSLSDKKNLIVKTKTTSKAKYEQDLDALLLHEFAHEYESDHLSDAYHQAICRLGAKLKRLAIVNPEMFKQA